MGNKEGREKKVRGAAGRIFKASLCAVPRASGESDSASDTEVFLNSSKMTNYKSKACNRR